MSCRRAHELDLAAYCVEPALAEFDDFRAHVPGCGDCSAEVGAWGALVAQLRGAGEGGAHPSEERLAALQSSPAALTAEERGRLDLHLAGCVQCRSELAVLRGFDWDALALPVAARAGLGVRLRDAVTAMADGLFGVPQPALAVAALLVLAVPAAWLGWEMVGGSAGEPLAELAQQQTPPPESPVVPAAPLPVEPEEERIAVARETEPPPAREDTPAPAPEPIEVAQQPVPAEPAPRPPTVSPRGVAPAPDPAPMRIAALLPSELPVYTPDAALSGGALDVLASATVVRARGADLPEIRVYGPHHLGVTAEASPTLFWGLDGAATVPVELSVVAEQSGELLLERRVEAPRAGVHGLSLSEAGVELPVGQPLLWYATLVADEDRRDLDVVAGAGLLRVEPSRALRERLERTPEERRVHVLARAGYWYDAFATVSHWIDEEPEAERLIEYREALVSQLR